jgi:hypothetical protein
MRRKLEDVVKKISPVKDTRDTKLPEKVIKETKSWLEAAGCGVDQNVKVPPTNFTLDLLIRDERFWVASEIETGEGARIELDLLKLTAFAKRTQKTRNWPIYGWLLVSDKFLLRTTTGTPNETGFSYVRRVLRLLDLHQSGLDDLLVVEFQTSRI